jgi:hypothetical protein
MGFPGRRVDAMRAGITIIVLAISIMMWRKLDWFQGFGVKRGKLRVGPYTGCSGDEKQLVSGANALSALQIKKGSCF